MYENKFIGFNRVERRYFEMKGMRIAFILVIAVAFIFASSMIVMAENSNSLNNNSLSNNSGIELPDAGITPDSFLYGLDTAFERISIALTLGDDKKAEKALDIAEEKLSEIKKMIEEGKFDKAEIAQKNHDDSLERVNELINNLESNGNNQSTEKALERIIELEIKTMSHSEKVAFIKNRILERQSDRMTDEQIAHLEEVFGKIKDKSEEAEINALNKKEKIKIKYKVFSEKSDDDVYEFEKKIEKKFNDKDKHESEFRNKSSTGKTKVEIQGNVRLSSEIQSVIEEFVSSLEGNRTSKEVEIELKILKVSDSVADSSSSNDSLSNSTLNQINTNSTNLSSNSSIFLEGNGSSSVQVIKEEIKGNLDNHQLELWEQIRELAINDLASSDVLVGSKVEISIEHKYELEDKKEHHKDEKNGQDIDSEADDEISIEHKYELEDKKEHHKDEKNGQDIDSETDDETSKKDIDSHDESDDSSSESSSSGSSSITGNVVYSGSSKGSDERSEHSDSDSSSSEDSHRDSEDKSFEEEDD